MHEDAPMNEATFTFQVDESRKDQFTMAAKACHRSDADILRDLMREFIEQQQSTDDADALFRRQVEAGLESANAGRLVPAEEVEAEFSARREKTERSIAARS
jgi:predicted transcriptional regulator